MALLDSGATHAVIPFHARLQNLERVPVTLAGDEKQEWLRTQGGTLVVPPDPTSAGKGPVQTILPLGALLSPSDAKCIGQNVRGSVWYIQPLEC